MKLYMCLFKEVSCLQKDIKLYTRGLITYEEVKQRLVNISVLVDHLLNL